MHEEHGLDVGFRVDADDSIYWDVVEVAGKHLGVKPEKVGDVAFSRFGLCPFRYHQPPDHTAQYDWNPMHSMHPPEEVRAMLRELESVESAVQESGNEQARTDYAELTRTLKRITDDGRLLFVQVLPRRITFRSLFEPAAPPRVWTPS